MPSHAAPRCTRRRGVAAAVIAAAALSVGAMVIVAATSSPSSEVAFTAEVLGVSIEREAAPSPATPATTPAPAIAASTPTPPAALRRAVLPTSSLTTEPPADPRPPGTIDDDSPRSATGWTPVRVDATVALGDPTPAASSATNAAPIVTTAPVPTPTAAPAVASSSPTPAPEQTTEPAVTPTVELEVAASPEPTARPTAEPAPISDVASRGQDAMSLLPYNWQGRLPGWQILFLGERSGIRGLTFTGEQRIEIYVRPGDGSWDIARIVAHELGHAVDIALNSTSDRETWATQRGIGGRPWWPGAGASDFASGAGDFAECFAVWQVGASSLSTAGGCSQDDLNLIASLS